MPLMVIVISAINNNRNRTLRGVRLRIGIADCRNALTIILTIIGGAMEIILSIIM